MDVTARVQRSGDYWAVEVPEVPGVFTQAKRLDQVEEMVVDAVKTMTGEDAHVLCIEMEPELNALLLQLEELRRLAREAEGHLAAANRSMAVHLVKDYELPLRDVGKIMGISHQRVDQLLK